MKPKVTLTAVGVLGLAVALAWAAPQRDGPGAADEADFTGKFLGVTVKEPARGAVLQNARVKRLGGRSFLVGNSVKRADDDDAPEATYWFPVEDVQLIREYKTLEDLMKEYKAEPKAEK